MKNKIRRKLKESHGEKKMKALVKRISQKKFREEDNLGQEREVWGSGSGETVGGLF
jgi:hypothetical protein